MARLHIKITYRRPMLVKRVSVCERSEEHARYNQSVKKQPFSYAQCILIRSFIDRTQIHMKCRAREKAHTYTQSNAMRRMRSDGKINRYINRPSLSEKTTAHSNELHHQQQQQQQKFLNHLINQNVKRSLSLLLGARQCSRDYSSSSSSVCFRCAYEK